MKTQFTHQGLANMAKALFAIILFLALTGAARAESVVVALYAGGSPPLFFDKKSSETGIYVDILNEIGQLTGIKFEYKYYPTKRVMTLFEDGGVDIEPGINPVWRSNANVKGIFSTPFAKAEDVVVFPAGKVKAVKGAKDLKGMNVGTIRGFYYGGYMDAFASGEIHRKDSVDEDQLMLKLSHGRLDTIFIRKEAAEYRIKINDAYKNLKIGDVIGSADISFRIHPKRKNLVDGINKAIEQLKSSGRIDAIYAKYR